MAYDRTPLAPEAIQQFLREHPEWTHREQKLVRTFRFPSFPAGLAFVNLVAKVAEAHQHHPDIDLRYREVTLALTTHDAGGLTFRDPQLAAECDRLYQSGTIGG